MGEGTLKETERRDSEAGRGDYGELAHRKINSENRGSDDKAAISEEQWAGQLKV